MAEFASGRSRAMDGDRQDWLTTGQAARFCSVKPDTILKWIKRGRLRAERTAGGHYRIQRQELEPLILRPRATADPRTNPVFPGNPLRCWEYLGASDRASSATPGHPRDVPPRAR